MNRLQALLDAAQAQGLDALALMPGPNLFYVTGLSFHVSERPILAFFPVDQAPAFVLPALEAGKVSHLNNFPYTDEEGYALAFHEACASLELAEARIGVELFGIRLLEARILERYASGSELLPADDLLSSLRLIKGPEEIAALRRAVSVTENAFWSWLDELRLGMTETEAAARLTAALVAAGAEGPAFAPIVAGGPNGALPHAVPGSRPFETGDWVVVDWGASVGGYVADITRMVVFGEPEGELAKLHELVRRANAAGRAAARPGLPAEAVDAVTRAVIEEAGYGASFTHRTGHGLGLEAHEPPSLVTGDRTRLEPGCVFTVEPGIYLEGLGGIRIEDDVLITPEGSETLTSLPREPFVIS